jgi:hypothetical protein
VQDEESELRIADREGATFTSGLRIRRDPPLAYWATSAIRLAPKSRRVINGGSPAWKNTRDIGMTTCRMTTQSLHHPRSAIHFARLPQ